MIDQFIGFGAIIVFLVIYVAFLHWIIQHRDERGKDEVQKNIFKAQEKEK